MPRHPSQPGFPPLGPCDNPPGRTMFLVMKLALIVMTAMAGHKPDGTGFCDPMVPPGAELGDSCINRIPNGPHQGRALNDGGVPREVPGCGGSS